MLDPTSIGGRIVVSIFTVGVIFSAAHLYVGHVRRGGYEAAVADRAAADAVASLRRTQENTGLAIKQTDTNTLITERKNEELAPVVKRIYVDRVRVGPSLCAGPAPAPQAEGAAGGDGANPASRLVSEELERRIRELEVRVEKALATGRACQQFVRDNGME